MYGGMSTCVCVSIGLVLVEPGPHTFSCFPDVLGVVASVTIEKVHDVGGIAGQPVSDCEHFTYSLTSESSCFLWMLLTHQTF